MCKTNDKNQSSSGGAGASGSLMRWAKLVIAAAFAAGLAALGATALLVNIFERKQEARNPFFRVV